MEIVSGIKIKDIFLDNGNWWKFFLKHKDLIRLSIISNVLKLLICRTSFLGYHHYVCPNCKKGIKVPHTCKSRFCSTCGKKATDNWIEKNFNILPDTKWQHIIFTMPDKLWIFFWHNRYLINLIPPIAANIIKEHAKEKGIKPGIFLAIHTFGRDLKRNIHIHLSTTIGGLSLDHKEWIKNCYFPESKLKSMWRYAIIKLLRDEYKDGNLKLPPSLKHVKTYDSFASWTSQFYKITWNVQLNKHNENKAINLKYIGRYVKRPPIGETRIKSYDGKNVVFEYLDHYTNSVDTMDLPVYDFIARLICHIHDKNFRVFRYYGFLANRVRSTLLPIVYTFLNMKDVITNVYITWREMIINTLKKDPLYCYLCNKEMILNSFVLPPPTNTINDEHEKIANGFYSFVLT
ncbi:MAG: IS91 family transposase [Bacteroidetes bacterium]|nr:IS91 family transposase [Bacteroidota bacterium]